MHKRRYEFVMPSLPPPAKLSILRDIGWGQWDPIGLQVLEGGWQGSDASDEYDVYLLHVAVQLQHGEPEANLIEYLVFIETEHMGMGLGPKARTRAIATVEAIGKYVRSLA